MLLFDETVTFIIQWLFSLLVSGFLLKVFNSEVFRNWNLGKARTSLWVLYICICLWFKFLMKMFIV